MIKEIIKIAREAGKIIEEQKKVKQELFTKGDDTVVTTTDIKVNKYVVSELKRCYPDVEILSEEAKNDVKAKSFFVVDPLDGTQEFLNSIDDPKFVEYAVQIGYVKDGEAVLGVVYMPAVDRLYYAEKGKGAFVVDKGEEQRLNTKHSDKAVIGRYNIDDDLKELVKERYSKSLEEVGLGGSFGVKVCKVADGTFNEFIHTNYDKNKVHASLWDSCAPDLILREAGGRSFQINNLQPVKYCVDCVNLTKGYVASSNKYKKLLIFDVDGVLGNFEKLRKLRDAAHCKAIAAKNGVSPLDAEKLLAETRLKLKEQGKYSTIDAMQALGISKKEFYNIMNSVPVDGNIVLTPHAKDVISKLKKDNAIVALTNTPTQATLATLRYLGLLHYFDGVYCIDMYDFIKPSVAIFKRILQDFCAESAYSIGDSVKKDLEPAKKVGLNTVHFSNKDDKSDLREVLKILDSF